ncbi:Sir2 family [Fragilaria crotonensis]|nr:Sir2 family [Fragilaria crotonensis]
MRVVVNREPVGYQLGIDYSEQSKRDFFAQGEVDEVLLDLAVELGWLEDLQKLCGQLPEKSDQVLKERTEREAAAASAKRLRVEWIVLPSQTSLSFSSLPAQCST